MKRFELGIYGIAVEVEFLDDGEAGRIGSDLTHGNDDDNEEVVGILSVILGHAMAGIDVTSSAYVEGIDSALGAAGVN